MHRPSPFAGSSHASSSRKQSSTGAVHKGKTRDSGFGEAEAMGMAMEEDVVREPRVFEVLWRDPQARKNKSWDSCVLSLLLLFTSAWGAEETRGELQLTRVGRCDVGTVCW